MALFRRETNGESAAAQPADGARRDRAGADRASNAIGEGTVFEGTLYAQSDVRVGGRLRGQLEVDGGRVIVTQEGVIEGEVHATDADIGGTVQGEMYVTERLTLRSTARVDGNIESGRIEVEDGALFIGHCKIGEQVSERVQEQVGEEEAPPHPAEPSSPAEPPSPEEERVLPEEGPPPGATVASAAASAPEGEPREMPSGDVPEDDDMAGGDAPRRAEEQPEPSEAPGR